MAAAPTRGAGVVPVILEGEAGEAGEVLRSLTFVGDCDGRTASSTVRGDARRWPESEAVAFRREHLSDRPDAIAPDPGGGRGYTFPVGPLTVDLLWFPGDGALHYQVSRAGVPLRRLQTGGAGDGRAWGEPGRGPQKAPDGPTAARESKVGRLPGAVVRGAADMVTRFEQEPYWQAEAVVAGAIWLVLGLTKKTTVGPIWLQPASEALLLAALIYTDPGRQLRHGRAPHSRLWPRLTLAFVGLVNTGSLGLLVHELLTSKAKAGGHALILAASVTWLTNVVIFALAFWELDRGGPDRRSDPASEGKPNFLFPLMAVGGKLGEGFRPTFFDYLYTSTTNATAFSPTDTMPLGAPAKALMMIQAIASLVTVGLVAARAVNILT